MSKPVLLQDRFTGMWRDSPRDQLPPGKVHDLVDMFPDLGAPLGKRGGWSYEGVALDTLDAAATVPNKVAWAPFASSQVVAIDDAGKLFDVTNGVDRGDSQPTHIPVFYRDLLIIPHSGGTAVPDKYNGTTIADLGGSPPTARLVAVYKDRLLAARTNALPQRIYFSGAGNPESWDTTLRWLDTSASIEGVAPLRDSIIVFHQGSVERIRGSIPPGSAAADMRLDPLFDNMGLIWPNAFAVDGDSVVWADEDGVYLTDGNSPSDLTQQGGISQYWRTEVLDAATVAVGIWRGYAFVSLLNSSSGGYENFLVCELRTRSWFRCNHIRAKNFANRYGTTNEFYFSNQATKRVGELSSIFSPASANKTNADATSISPTVETAFFTPGSKGKQRWRHLYVRYDVRDSVDAVTMTPQYVTTPDETSYTSTFAALPETTRLTRSRARLSFSSLGAAFKLSANSPDSHKLYSLEADVHALESSRR